MAGAIVLLAVAIAVGLISVENGLIHIAKAIRETAEQKRQ